MFSLVISIIAIALVAILAIATIWYGTDAYNQNKTTAGAAQIINETEQIEGAILAFNVEQGRQPEVCEFDPANPEVCPEPLHELISYDYLTSAPTSDTSDGIWTVAVIAKGSAGEEDVKALVKTVNMEECEEANSMMEFVGVTAYNASLPTPPEGETSPTLDQALDADGAAIDLIPECAAEMPSQVVCCQTVTGDPA